MQLALQFGDSVREVKASFGASAKSKVNIFICGIDSEALRPFVNTLRTVAFISDVNFVSTESEVAAECFNVKEADGLGLYVDFAEHIDVKAASASIAKKVGKVDQALVQASRKLEKTEDEVARQKMAEKITQLQASQQSFFLPAEGHRVST